MNKSKPAQDPPVMSMGKDRSQEPLFEEWERPRRRNRNREKPTLSGFVRSTVHGKDRSRPRSAVSQFQLHSFLLPLSSSTMDVVIQMPSPEPPLPSTNDVVSYDYIEVSVAVFSDSYKVGCCQA